MKPPVISVIMPCYNQASYLDEALDSLQAQTIQNWECIIINDESPDDTERVALALCKKESRLKYVSQKNAGPSGARNTGIALAQGEYILPLDADDKIHPDYIGKCVSLLKAHPGLKLVYAKAQKFGAATGEWMLADYSYRQLLLNNMIYCSAIFRRTDFLKTSGYDETMRHGYEDWEFWLRFLSDDSEVHRINEVLFFYRIKEESRTTSVTPELEQELHTYLYFKHKEKYGAYFGDPLNLLRENLMLKKMYRDSIDYSVGNKLIHPVRSLHKGLGNLMKSK